MASEAITKCYIGKKPSIQQTDGYECLSCTDVVRILQRPHILLRASRTSPRTPSSGSTDLNYPHPPPSSPSPASCLPTSPPSLLHLPSPSPPLPHSFLPVFRHQHSALQQQASQTGGLFKSRRCVALVPSLPFPCPSLPCPALPSLPSLPCSCVVYADLLAWAERPQGVEGG